MKHSLLLAASHLAVHAFLTTCRVHDRRPESIPKGCHICMSDIEITSTTHWPAGLSLQVVQGLTISAAAPAFESTFHVDALSLTGDLAGEVDLTKISADKIFISELKGTPVFMFEDCQPTTLAIMNANATITGLSSHTLRLVSLVNGTPVATRLASAAKAGVVDISGSNVVLQDFLPNLREIQHLTVEYCSMPELALPLERVLGNVLIKDNPALESVVLPFLDQVVGSFSVVGKHALTSIALPSLKKVAILNANVKVEAPGIGT